MAAAAFDSVFTDVETALRELVAAGYAYSSSLGGKEEDDDFEIE
jgi:hypothetical protein